MKKIILVIMMVCILLALAACKEPAQDYIEAVPPIAELTPEEISQSWTSLLSQDTVPIIVDDVAIEAPKPITDETGGVLMLPLIPIADALGYTTVDNGNEVVITPGTTVTEGVNSYARAREAARELSSAPIVQDGVMFVPWEFFQEILSAVAYVESGTVYVVTVEDGGDLEPVG